MATVSTIDIQESSLRRTGDLLNILLLDRTTGKNLIWATDSYVRYGKVFAAKNLIKPELVTGAYSKLIQPRAAKSLEEQRQRTRDKGEVFTPLRIVDKLNKEIDWSGNIRVPDNTNWQDYIKELKLEIACGEGPFIVSRYNPTAHTGKLIKLQHRVGFLDRKLRVVSRYCDKPKEWLFWSKEAFMASYGYEWQGDNILIARENLLYTLIDYYKAKFNRRPSTKTLQEFAEIISWNIFQMDGIKYVIPMSCRHEIRVIPGEYTLFWQTPDVVEKDECEGCKFNRPTGHNGKYAKVMDWSTNKTINFVSLLEQRERFIGK
jgi:hypothetical protein